MNILQVHNRYKDLGGEDVVVAREKKMMEDAGHEVSQFIVSNESIDSTSKKLETAFMMPYALGQKRSLKRFLKTVKPDVVHVHNVFPMLSPAILYACKELSLPVILTVHNYRLLCLNGLLFRDGKVCELCINKKWATPGIKYGCYQNCSAISIFPALTNGLHATLSTWIKNVDKVIFLSGFSKSVFDRSHMDFKPEQTVLKPNFVIDHGYSLQKQDYYLYAGRLSEEKGIREAIDCFSQLGLKLRVAGEGPLTEWVRKAAAENGNIEFLGFQKGEDLQKLYKKARAIIFPSKWYEGMPLVILEAFSHGTPVIATDFGNAGTLVQHGVNGLKYDPSEQEGLTNILLEFERHDKIALAKGARSTFKRQYSEKVNLGQTLKIYEEAIISNKSQKP